MKRRATTIQTLQIITLGSISISFTQGNHVQKLITNWPLDSNDNARTKKIVSRDIRQTNLYLPFLTIPFESSSFSNKEAH